MSNKPKLYGFCNAGCKWETVHKEDVDNIKNTLPYLEELDYGARFEIGNKYAIAFAEGTTTATLTLLCKFSYEETGDDGGSYTEYIKLPNIASVNGNYLFKIHSIDWSLEYVTTDGGIKHQLTLTYAIECNGKLEVVVSKNYVGVTYDFNDQTITVPDVNGDTATFRIVLTTYQNVEHVYQVKNENAAVAIPYQVFIRYADDENGTNMTETYTGQLYMGTYVGEEASEEPSDYTWSRFYSESPVTDSELSTTSVNPVQNKAITTAINSLDSRVSTNENNISTSKSDILNRVKYNEVLDRFSSSSTLPIQSKIITHKVEAIEDDIEINQNDIRAIKSLLYFYIYNDYGYLKVDYNTNQPNFSINANGELIYEGDLSLSRSANNIILSF